MEHSPTNRYDEGTKMKNQNSNKKNAGDTTSKDVSDIEYKKEFRTIRNGWIS